MRHPDDWIARAQVWLGTLVEVALPASGASDACFAAAFAAIAHIHRTLSAHDTGSDLARIARDAHQRAVVVDQETYAVLVLAKALHGESDGAFDVTIAPLLARVGLLPASSTSPDAQWSRMDALHLDSDLCVRTDVPLALDLGGIAKGHAVDCAIAALRTTGARAGLVNAGGDLRVFGDDLWLPVWVRHPATPATTVQLFDVRDCAVATSADYFRASRASLFDNRARTLQHASRHALRRYPGSITIIAATCALADALAKIVALRPAESAALLARYDAQAFVLGDQHDSGLCKTTCSASTPHLRLPLAVAA